MTSTTAATPAKAKVLLETLQKVTADDAATPSLSVLCRAMLVLEMLQRGMLLLTATTAGGADDDDMAKLFAAVQDVAGKSLLTADTVLLPKPVLRDACGLQGKIATSIARRATDDDTAAFRQASFFKQTIAAVVKRCQDVNDDRFLVLLKIWNQEYAADAAAHWQWIAHACFSRAASQFAPDAAPLWRWAWEASKQQSSSSSSSSSSFKNIQHWELPGSISALTALRRIMQTKGNQKRAAELNVRLATAWMHAAHTALTTPGSSSSTTTSLASKLVQAFGVPDEGNNVTPAKALASAQAALDKVSPTLLSTQEACLYQIATVEILALQHATGIQLESTNGQQQAKNRSATMSSQKIQAQARQVYFLAWNDGNTVQGAYQAAKRLLQQCFPPQEMEFSMRGAALSAMTQFLADQRDYCLALQAASAKKALEEESAQVQWIQLGQFIASCISLYSVDNMKEQIDAFVAAERDFFQEICHLTCQVSWMTCSSHLNDNKETVLPFSASHFDLVGTAVDILCAQQQQLAATKAKTAAVSSTSQAEQVQYVRLRVAACAAKCWVLLHQQVEASSSSSAIILEITNEMLSLCNTSSSDLLVETDALHGATFLGSILAWSGFFRTPWEFCIVPEARSMINKTRLVLKQSKAIYKRTAHASEAILLDLAEADAESSGLKDKAQRLCQEILDSSILAEHNQVLSALVRARCLLGLARLAPTKQRQIDASTSDKRPEESLAILQSLAPSDATLSVWKSLGAQHAAIRSQIVLSRQIMAETLIAVGFLQQAGEFLQEAVKDAPSDQVAAFALGSYLLRMVFFHGQSSPEAQKVAQTHLVKAAKLDSTKAGPFALLGYWYEFRNDAKRAVGCYSKALILEPSHPVAGRGMLRLADDASKDKVLQRAIVSTSSLNGWAWLFIGVAKAKIEAEYELAVSALLKATRARDIEHPMSDPLSIFYSGPLRPETPNHDELVKGLLELSACYRRLGRCSAEVRTLHTALEVSGEMASWSLLHACGQAEMEMGLIEDAKERFAKAADSTSGSRKQASLFGKGMSAFLIGRRDLQDGKVGAALQHIMDAIAACIPLAGGSCSLSKLVGDMHSFLAAFPTELFDENYEPGASSDCLTNHLKIISRGADFYASGLEILKRSQDENHTPESMASLVCDGAVNLLLQAQLAANWKGLSGHECTSDPTIMSIFHQAQNRFVEALRIDPLHPPSWCGYGCSVVGEPIKAQHAFSRAVELDSASPEPYANLGFLYLESQAFGKSAEVCDVLTQIADTHMTWINRAYQLEKNALDKEDKAAHDIEQITDAYRAALQVQKEPFALLGLAASFRVAAATASAGQGNEFENQTLLGEFQSITSIHPSSVFSLGSRERETAPAPLDNIPTPVSVLGTKHAILERPDRGDAWLGLCRELVLELSGDDDINESNSQPARAAARRASTLLLGKVTDPSSGRKDEGVVVASDLSDSLALESWLDTHENAVASKKKAQLALLICPQNTLAREILTSSN